MANIKWVKLTTDMFDNRKIKHLRRLPEGNNIVLIWVMLLTMAGRCNSSGMIFLTENIPYTPKMLADELDFEENTVQLALQALEQLNMIVTDGGFFTIAGWEEYQNIEGMERIRESKRLAQARWRAKKKEESSTVDSTRYLVDYAEEDIEEDKDKEKDNKRVKHKHGEYKNVLLTDDEYDKLQAEFPDLSERIERLSEYIESKGAKYKSHYATIRAWAKKDTKPTYQRQTKADELENAYNMMAAWSEGGNENA
jgi:predicted phage replisome organizer